jgi:predicted N-acetyltransferase YhbS
VPRTPVTTRTATVADLPVLDQFLAELRQIGGRAERAVTPSIGEAEVIKRLLADLLVAADSRVVLACIGDEPAGLAVMRKVRPDPLSETELVQLAHLLVRSGMRHRGVGHALVEAAAFFAMEAHVEHVAVSVYPSLRDASRFYARLGFAPAALHRVAPVHVLRRRMGKDRQQPAALSDLVRRGRSMRSLPPQRPRRPAQPIDNAS